MIYSQVCIRPKSFGEDGLLLEVSSDDVDRQYREYVPSSYILSVPIKRTDEDETAVVRTLQQGKIDVIAATIDETIKDIEGRMRFLKDLNELLKHQNV